MAKKKRKRKTGPRLSASQAYRPTATESAAATPRTVAVTATPRGESAIPTEEELAEEYHYVLTDLKRIAQLALAMLVLLIGLSWILV